MTSVIAIPHHCQGSRLAKLIDILLTCRRVSFSVFLSAKPTGIGSAFGEFLSITG